MKVLELFAGSRSFSKVAEEMGLVTFTTDFNNFDNVVLTSRNAVDGSTAATTNTLPLKIIDFVDGPDTEIGDSFTDVLVMFNV